MSELIGMTIGEFETLRFATATDRGDAIFYHDTYCSLCWSNKHSVERLIEMGFVAIKRRATSRSRGKVIVTELGRRTFFEQRKKEGWEGTYEQFTNSN